MFHAAYGEMKNPILIIQFICREKIAYSKFPKLCHLVKSLGLKLTYQKLFISRYGALEIIKALNEFMERTNCKNKRS